MTKRTLDELETHFNIVANDRKVVEVYSDDPVYQRKLERVGAEVTGETADGAGRFYRLDGRQLLLRKVPAKRTLSPAQLAALRQGKRKAGAPSA